MTVTLFKINTTLIKIKLLELNLNLREFAEKVNLSQATITNILKGKPGTIKTLNRIAKGLDMPVTELLEK